MVEATEGARVRLAYEARRARDDEPVDAADPHDPLEFTVGAGEVIPGLDAAVRGMTAGDEREVEVPPEAAYGFPTAGSETTVPRADLPGDLAPDPGDVLTLEDDEDRLHPVTVLAVDGPEITVDADHPLAGETLRFSLRMLAVEPDG